MRISDIIAQIVLRVGAAFGFGMAASVIHRGAFCAPVFWWTCLGVLSTLAVLRQPRG